MRKQVLRFAFVAAAACLVASYGGLTAQQAPAGFHWPEGKRVAVSFSFDDARESQVDVGVPLFDKYDAKATFYVNPPNMKNRLELWKRAAAKGHEIGNHSETHPCSGNFPWSRKNALEAMTPAMIEREMTLANEDALRMVGVKPTTFAYPCGQKYIGRGTGTKSYVPIVAKLFRVGRGFRDEAPNDPLYCDMAQLLGIQSDGMSFEELQKATEDAAKEGAWLVFAGHEIGGKAFQSTETAALEPYLKYAKDPASGIWLDTIDNVSKYVLAHRPAH